MEYSVFDAHCDTLCKMADSGEAFYANGCEVSAELMSRYRSYTQVMACFISPKYHRSAIKRTMTLINTYRRAVENRAEDNIKTVLSIEGGEGIKTIADLELYYGLGVRMAALTWNKSNHIAGGAHERSRSRGLTEFGGAVVRRMNELGMYIDVSHLNDRSFYDIADISAAPLIASHSNSRAICHHVRNLTDDMFKKIMASGGCAGINLYPVFLTNTRRAVIDDAVRHIEHFMSLGGENHVGIGADFDGTDGCLPDGIRGCGDLYKLFDRLAQLNYTEKQIEKISHANFERLFGNMQLSPEKKLFM